MRTTLVLFAIMVFVVLSMEAAGSRRKSTKLRPLPGRRQRIRRPWMRLKRKVVVIKNKKLSGTEKLRKIGDPLPERTDMGIRKNEHYIDPELLQKFRKVKDMKDFVKLFKPKGFTIKEEVIHRKPSGKEGDSKRDETRVETNIYYQGKKYRNIAQDATKSFACIPRSTPLSLETLGKITFPSCTFVKRCGGCCSAAMECVADKTTTRQIDVFEIFSNYNVRQGKKTLVDHSSCKCDCIVKASHCTGRQTYSKKNCQCECKTKPQKCPTGKEWSRPKCDCVCKQRQICTSHLRIWDENQCKCGCIKRACPFGQKRSPENCRCSSLVREAVEPFTRDFEPEDFDTGTDDSSPDDTWGDF